MAKFHINPETGEPGKCSAAEGNCPYKDVSNHFDSAADARKGYEEEMEARAKYEELTNLAGELIEKTLALRAVLDERQKHTAKDPEWADIRERAAAAKKAHQKVLAKVEQQGLNARSLILGVDTKGNIFNKDQLYRVRPYPGEVYTKMANVPIRPGSDLPVPGDAAIERSKKRWEKEKAKLEELAFGSAEREAARKSLIRRIIKETPDKHAITELKTDLSSWEIQKLASSTPGVFEVSEMRVKAGVDARGDSDEAWAFRQRSLKAAQEFIDGL